MHNEAPEESIKHSNLNEVNFVKKVLGEMKTKFNKADISDPSTVDCNMKDHESEVNNITETFESTLTKKTESTSNGQSDPPNENDSNEKLPEESTNEPRIVMLLTKSPNAKLKSTTTKKALKNRPHDKIDNKRLSLRRGRDSNESVLQSAIARKEKSYNESIKPQRLIRKIKPVQKDLDAVEKLKGSGKNNLNKMVYDGKKLSTNKRRSSLINDKQHKKKFKFAKPSLSMSQDGDKIVITMNKRSANIEEEKCRRSQRISSGHYKEQSLVKETSAEQSIDIKKTRERIKSNSYLCLCTNVTNICVSPEHQARICTALDTIEEKVFGCSINFNIKRSFTVRPSTRVPYQWFCNFHLHRLLRHQCCPTCGIFCTQGNFLCCDDMHLYHIGCQIDNKLCPHCEKPTINTHINMIVSN